VPAEGAGYLSSASYNWEYMEARQAFDWDVTPREAIDLQRRLAPLVVTSGDPAPVQLVAGVDISVGGRVRRTPGRGAVVVLSIPSLVAVEQSTVEQQPTFPYVPGLLSFREIPVLLPAFLRLRAQPDLLVVDGQGYAHPRRIGLASHLGLVFDLPSIGCAKSRLIGEYGDLGEDRGSIAYLRDRGEVIGAAVRTRRGTKPIFVSSGHRVGLDEAVEWTLRLTPRYRIPEPTRLAHQAAAGQQVVQGAAVQP
jgi:deoxyribonuclease V